MALLKIIAVLIYMHEIGVHSIDHQDRSSSCDFGIADPPHWTGVLETQWCAMIRGELTSLRTQEAPDVVLPSIKAEYVQADIQIDPESCLADVAYIMRDGEARAAMTQMKANYPRLGSMDLTVDGIYQVYADSIKAASEKTGVPEDIMTNIIFTESKGHPLVYQGLTQMDYVAWGQMASQNTKLHNRYMPSDNIMASAMYLATKQRQYGCDWKACYVAFYQG